MTAKPSETVSRRTPLYHEHLDLEARMVDFAGWKMPIQYPSGINEEHMAVRTEAGIFDVSHMGEIRVQGKDALAFLRYATLNEPNKLKPGRAQYSMLPNDQGGLIDDIYLYQLNENEYLIVCNAANTGAVVAHLQMLAQDFDMSLRDESEVWALMAVQGPGAALLLGRRTEDSLSGLKKNRLMRTSLADCQVTLCRTGYTGEDGFEVFCRPQDAAHLWQTLLKAGAKPCGLGARDTLRLEAGFPLFGHEFGAETNPLCSSYSWVVKDKDFHGREAMWSPGCKEKLIGLRLTERGIPREGYKLFAQDEHIGKVTSGTISPLTRESIALGWVNADYAEDGQAIQVEIRGQKVAAEVTSPPFYQS